MASGFLAGAGDNSTRVTQFMGLWERTVVSDLRRWSDPLGPRALRHGHEKRFSFNGPCLYRTRGELIMDLSTVFKVEAVLSGARIATIQS